MQRISEGGKRGRENQPIVVVPQAVIPQSVVRIKATSLRKFNGFKSDFYSWWRAWENLQRQGEPRLSGSKKSSSSLIVWMRGYLETCGC